MEADVARPPLVHLAAPILALAAAVLLLVLPVYSSGSTLVEANGSGVLAVLAVPVALTLLPLAFPPSRRKVVTVVALALLALGVAVSIASVGVFFVPALMAMALSAARRSGPRAAGA